MIQQKKSALCFVAAVCVASLATPVFADSEALGPLPSAKISEAKAELGKRLFFDRRLSGDAAISCSDCHIPENGFAHPDALSPGYPGNEHFRNSPTLINVAFKKVWLHDGRLGTSLNDVTREMITEDYSMNMDMRIMQERLKQDPQYVQMFKDAGYGEPSNGGVRKAIPEFLQSLVSKNVPFDQGKLSSSAKRGQKLFEGKAGCVACHNGPLLTDQQVHNTGVPENYDIFLDPMKHQAFIAFTRNMGVENYMNLKRDPGAYIRMHDVNLVAMGTFLTPTLRELKHTAPYMHNGMLASLSDVVEFYNQGGGQDSMKSELIKPLGLSSQNKKDLVSFLESLSGDPLTGSDYVWQEAYPAEYEAIPNWRDARN